MAHLLIGALLTSLGFWTLYIWWDNFGITVRALLPFMLLLGGLVALLSRYYRTSLDEDEDEDDVDDEVESTAARRRTPETSTEEG